MPERMRVTTTREDFMRTPLRCIRPRSQDISTSCRCWSSACAPRPQRHSLQWHGRGLGYADDNPVLRNAIARPGKRALVPAANSRRKLKAFLQNRGTGQHHQDLVVRDTRALIHAAEPIEEADNFPL